DTRLERERDLLYEAVPLELALGEASQARKLSIVLLDACRNNPFIDRMSRSMTVASRGSAGPGLARVDNVPRNTMVVMSTKADQVAEDGGGDHSPFAEALLKHLAIPGVELSLFFRSVRDTVLQTTDGRQEPYVFSSLGAEPFYFNPRPPNRPPVLGSMPPLEVRDTAGPTPLLIGVPTDPDQDPLTVRITGLPRYGEVQVDGRMVGPGAVFAADRIATATYKPEAGRIGPVGTLDILVEDGRGGNAMGSLAVNVLPSNRPPVAEARRRIRIYTGALNIARPEDPDGDPISVTIRTLPRGQVRNGSTVLRLGDRVRPDDLTALSFVPEPGFVGFAGSLQYLVEDGRGGRAEGILEIDVMDAVEGAAQMAELALWERVRTRGQEEDLETFLRLYPGSQYAEAAQRLRRDLLGRGASPPPPILAQPPQAATPAMPHAAEAPAVQAAPPPAPAPERFALLQSGPSHPQSGPVTAQDVPRAVFSSKPAAPHPEERYFQDCPLCPLMVRVPGGSFMMGQGTKDAAALPIRRVTLRPFALGQYPVTIAEWKACAADGGCGAPPRMAVTDDRTPVHNVSWDDARQYVVWLSRKTGQPYRLPSEAEWEYAARAGTSTRYWWGDQVGAGLANCSDCGGRQDARGPLPVDSSQPNPFGLNGMLGGVAQWTQDCWAPNYQGAPSDGTARESRACLKRVLRGGSFHSDHDDILPIARNFYDAPVRYVSNGFRVARSLN
ncbi:MAG TPA: SUMF1/EgtB/PvdO family nonheme iron enzyme, partial [Acetobacteraceae bacterium]